MALTRLVWWRDADVRPWPDQPLTDSLIPTNATRLKVWQELEAESIRQRRHLGYLPPEETELEPAAVAVPEPEPKPRRKRKPRRKKELTPDQRRSLAWENLKLRREEP